MYVYIQWTTAKDLGHNDFWVNTRACQAPKPPATCRAGQPRHIQASPPQNLLSFLPQLGDSNAKVTGSKGWNALGLFKAPLLGHFMLT